MAELEVDSGIDPEATHRHLRSRGTEGCAPADGGAPSHRYSLEVVAGFYAALPAHLIPAPVGRAYVDTDARTTTSGRGPTSAWGTTTLDHLTVTATWNYGKLDPPDRDRTLHLGPHGWPELNRRTTYRGRPVWAPPGPQHPPHSARSTGGVARNPHHDAALPEAEAEGPVLRNPTKTEALEPKRDPPLIGLLMVNVPDPGTAR